MRITVPFRRVAFACVLLSLACGRAHGGNSVLIMAVVKGDSPGKVFRERLEEADRAVWNRNIPMLETLGLEGLRLVTTGMEGEDRKLSDLETVDENLGKVQLEIALKTSGKEGPLLLLRLREPGMERRDLKVNLVGDGDIVQLSDRLALLWRIEK